jgi:hypothetical protein
VQLGEALVEFLGAGVLAVLFQRAEDCQTCSCHLQTRGTQSIRPFGCRFHRTFSEIVLIMNSDTLLILAHLAASRKMEKDPISSTFCQKDH